jgi:hypothetical protein
LGGVNLDPVIRELEDARTALVDPLEGLDDSSHLDILSETSAAVRDATSSYTKRDQLLTQAIKCLEELKAHGYPDLPSVSLSDAVTADLTEQSRTVQVAADLFRPAPVAPAASFKIEFAPKTPK